MTLPEIPINEAAFPKRNPNRFLPRSVPPVHVPVAGPEPVAPAPARTIDEYLASFYGEDYAKSALPAERIGYTQDYVGPAYEDEPVRTDRVFPWQMWVWSTLSLALVGLVFLLVL